MAVLIDGRYEVLSKIKEGGMGTVYKVRHVHLDDVRVVKVMRADILDDPDARTRFLREARLAKSLHHENIAVLHDFAEDRDGSFYMVLEFVDGPSLAEPLGQGKALPVRTVVEIAIQVLAALGHLHGKGIVHRDVSPENILLTLDGNGRPLVKLIDLGIAKETEGDGLTLSGMFLGKLKYASPEQLGALAKGEVIDGRSDLYSLGCVLYRLLTGEAPFRADTPQAYAMVHLMRDPRSFEETDSSGRVPPVVREIILKSVEKKRDRRWASAGDFAAALLEARPLIPEDPEGGAAVVHSIVRFREDHARVDEPENVTGILTTREPSPLSADPEGAPAPPTVVLASAGHGRPRAPRDRQATPAASVRTPPLRLAIGLGLGTAVAAAVAVVPLVVWPRLQTHFRPAPPRPAAVLLLTSSPWARVASVVHEPDGRAVPVSAESTPLSLSLPEGEYRVRLQGGPAGSGESTVQVSLAAGRETAVRVDLPGFDLEKTIRAYAP